MWNLIIAHCSSAEVKTFADAGLEKKYTCHQCQFTQ